MGGDGCGAGGGVSASRGAARLMAARRGSAGGCGRRASCGWRVDSASDVQPGYSERVWTLYMLRAAGALRARPRYTPPLHSAAVASVVLVSAVVLIVCVIISYVPCNVLLAPLWCIRLVVP